MDHHRAAPHSILWSNINTGIGSRNFESSGDGGGNGNHSASFITFWNVRCAPFTASLTDSVQHRYWHSNSLRCAHSVRQANAYLRATQPSALPE